MFSFVINLLQILFIILTCLVATKARAADGNSLYVCNQSQTNSINIAVVYVDDTPLIPFEKRSFHANGWIIIEPATCGDVFTNFSIYITFWIRLESKGRLISNVSDRYILPSKRMFCMNPKDGFAKNSDNLEIARNNCAPDQNPGLFPMQFGPTYGPVNYTLNVNPDSYVTSLPVDPANKIISIPLHSQEIVLYRLGDVSGSPSKVWSLESMLPKKQQVLECRYRNEKGGYLYSFWYKAPPANIDEIKKTDEEGSFAHYGSTAIKKCPSNREEAKNMSEANAVAWGRRYQ